MIALTEGQTSNVVVTLDEKTTIVTPTYLFVFVHITTKDAVRVAKLKTDDLSPFPKRYNEFSINASIFKNLGQYLYYVYEVAGSTASFFVDQNATLFEDEYGQQFISGATAMVPLSGLHEVENGKMVLLPVNSFTYTKYDPQTNYSVQQAHSNPAKFTVYAG